MARPRRPRTVRSSSASTSCWRGAYPVRLSRVRRKHPRDDVLHHRHHRNAQGRAITAIANWCCTPWDRRRWAAPAQRAFIANDVYMPITPMFHVHAWGFLMWRPCWGSSRFIRVVTTRGAARIDPNESVTFSHCVPTILQMMLPTPSGQHRPVGLENGDRRLALSRRLCRSGPGTWHRRVRRLRHERNRTGPDRRAPRAGLIAAGDNAARPRCACVPASHSACDVRIVDDQMNDVRPTTGKRKARSCFARRG